MVVCLGKNIQSEMEACVTNIDHEQTRRKESAMKKFIKVIMIIVAVLFIIFLLGRFGWKIGGFDACQNAGIPVKDEIDEVIMKTRMGERTVWNAYTGFISQSEPYGVFVKLEPSDAWSVSMRYEGLNNKMINTYYTACESGDHLFMNNDIIYVAKETEAPVPFTLTVYAEDDTVVAYGEFDFDVEKEKMYLTVTEDGRIVEEPAGV